MAISAVVFRRLALIVLILIGLFTIHSFLLENTDSYSLFTNSAHAQTTNYPQNRDTIVKNDLKSIVSGLNDMLYGKPNGEKGALSGAAGLIASLFREPPISGVAYISQEFHKLNPLRPAYAQAGPIGNEILSPALNLWRVIRNATYIGFVLVFVVIGFMVMFRAHISPQAVATVQDSLPRVVIALFLVTFSYAIAGLMIDLMFVLLNLGINILTQAGLTEQGRTAIFQHNVFKVYSDNWNDVFNSVADVVNEVLEGVLQTSDNVIGKIINFAIGGIAGVVLGLVAGIALLFVMFRVFLLLLMAYVMVILLTVSAPFFFLFQALPGQNGAKTWFKQYIANLSVFVVVPIMLLLGGLFDLGGSQVTAFQDQQTGYFPLLSDIVKAGAAGKLIGLGFLFMTPEAANLMKKFLGAQGAPGFGGAGAAALGASAGFLGARAKGSPPAQAMGALYKHGQEKLSYGIINKAPSFMKGGKTDVEPGVPVFKPKRP